jgi:hypothetical protein
VLWLAGTPDDPSHDVFLVRPGASNLLLINAERRETKRDADW